MTSTPRFTGDRCKCTACDLNFTSTSAFDKHRVGKLGVDRRCLPVVELRARGWSPNARGFWRRAMSTDALKRTRRAA
jgi:hypothetical protein